MPTLFSGPFDVFVVGKGSSSLGTMSMRKSNWSDLVKAFAMSDRDRVRRLLESAMIKARAVISEIKTGRRGSFRVTSESEVLRDSLSQALQNRMGAAR